MSAAVPLPRDCKDCGNEVGRPFALYCDRCRPGHRHNKPRRWVATEYIYAKIRQIYIERHDLRSAPIPNLVEFAEQIGWPHWAVKKRASELGVARTKERAWTEPELELLRTYAWKSAKSLSLLLKSRGYQRTTTAVALKLARTGYKQFESEHYSACSLAKAFGVDAAIVLRWIRFRYLKATRRGTDRTEQQGGDTWLITEADVRMFMHAHPMEYDLRKVDQLWFLNVFSKGRVGGNA